MASIKFERKTSDTDFEVVENAVIDVQSVAIQTWNHATDHARSFANANVKSNKIVYVDGDVTWRLTFSE